MKHLFSIIFLLCFAFSNAFGGVVEKNVSKVSISTGGQNLIQSQTLTDYHNQTTFRNAWNAIYTSIQLVDGIVAAPAVINSLPQLFTLVKESKYVLATKRFVKSNLFEFVKGEVSTAGSWITQRTSFWDDWINKCFPGKDWGNTTFITKGKDYTTFKTANTSIYNDMKALNSNEIKLQEYIESGSTIPVKVPINNGDVFFKIVKKGDNISTGSVYYVDQAQLNLIKANPEKLEQELGLPLSSVSAEYDVFKITYQGNGGYVFKSTVANTEQYANATQSLKYTTTGGRTQTLILNNLDDNVWIKSTSPVESIVPNQLPLI